MAGIEIAQINVQELAIQGRSPIVVDGWAGGPFCLIPPEGSKPGEEPDNEQVGHFPSGYGEIVPLTPNQAEEIKKQISEA